MFVINEDNSIYATRGDIVFLTVAAMNDDAAYTFKAGEVLRFKVFGKKDCKSVLRQKDFPVTSATQEVEIFLDSEFTKFGEVISKPRDYWYEVELNPFDDPQTIIGYDEDGAKVFRLFPEGADIEEYVPDEDDIPYVDDAFDMASVRPVQNQVIARAYEKLRADYKSVYDAVTRLNFTPQMYGAVGDGKADDTEALQSAIDAAKRVTGSTVCIPAGIYKITAPLVIYSATRLIGCGMCGESSEGYAGTHIKYAGTSGMSIIATESVLDTLYGIEIRDIRLSGDAECGIKLHSVTDCLIENVTVGGCGSGVYLSGSASRIRNLRAVSNEDAVELRGCHGVTVSELSASDNESTGIIIAENCEGVHICDSTVKNSQHGILFVNAVSCRGCAVDNMTFSADSNYPGARFISATFGNSSPGTFLVQGLSVRQCTVNIDSTTYGVYIDSSGNSVTAAFEDCSFFTNGTYSAAVYSANSGNCITVLRIICEGDDGAQNPVTGGSGVVYIPTQGDAVSSIDATNATVAGVAGKLNELIAALKESRAIK